MSDIEILVTNEVEVIVVEVEIPVAVARPQTFAIRAVGDIPAASFVNVYQSAGAAVRLANAAAATIYECNGFVALATTSADAAAVTCPGTIISGLSGLDAGLTYYLDPLNPGEIVAVPSYATGDEVQVIGVAVSDTQLFFFPQHIGTAP